jgi:hypothetical protein
MIIPGDGSWVSFVVHNFTLMISFSVIGWSYRRYSEIENENGNILGKSRFATEIRMSGSSDRCSYDVKSRNEDITRVNLGVLSVWNPHDEHSDICCDRSGEWCGSEGWLWSWLTGRRKGMFRHVPPQVEQYLLIRSSFSHQSVMVRILWDET